MLNWKQNGLTWAKCKCQPFGKLVWCFMKPKRGMHVHKITQHSASSSLTLTLYIRLQAHWLSCLCIENVHVPIVFALTKLWCEFKSYGQQQRLVQKTRHAIANVDRLHIWNHIAINDREIKTWRKHSAREGVLQKGTTIWETERWWEELIG